MRKLYPVDSLTSRRFALNWQDEVNKWKKMAALTEGVPHVLDLFKLYYFNDAHNIETTPRKQQHFATLPLISAARSFRGEISGGVANFLAVFSCYIETG